MKALDREVSRIFATERKRPHVGVRKKIDAEKGLLTLRVDRVYTPRPRIGLIASDAWHSFRSALDHLIFELAFIDGSGIEDDRLERTAFPASLTIENFRSNYVQKTLLARLTHDHRALVRRFQPYRRTYLPIEHHPLALLDALSNDDKHRLTQPGLLTAHQFTFRFTNPRRCYFPQLAAAGDLTGGKPLEPDTVLLAVPIVVTGANPEVDVTPNMAVYIGLRNGLDLWGVTSSIAEYCRGIVEVFAPEFETRKALRYRNVPRWGRIQPAEARPPETITGEMTLNL